MAEYDLISKTALLRHLDMAIDCEDCPRNTDRKTYYERCACSEVADICSTITYFATFADAQPVVDTENMATVSDEFICKKCGIYLKDYIKVVMDEDNDGYIDEQHYEYEPKFCPECGAKVKDGDVE